MIRDFPKLANKNIHQYFDLFKSLLVFLTHPPTMLRSFEKNGG